MFNKIAKIYKVAILVIVLSACYGSTESGKMIANMPKKSPVGNKAFLIAKSGDINETSNSSGLPRQNTNARSGAKSNIFSDFKELKEIEDISAVGGQNSHEYKSSGSILTAMRSDSGEESKQKSYNKVGLTRVSDGVKNVAFENDEKIRKSNAGQSGYVYLNRYSDEKSAIKDSVAISKYTGIDFFVQKLSDDLFVVKTKHLEKGDAYKIANTAVALGYYNVNVLS